MDSEEEGQAADLGFCDEMLSMAISDQFAAGGYKYCGDETGGLKMQEWTLTE